MPLPTAAPCARNRPTKKTIRHEGRASSSPDKIIIPVNVLILEIFWEPPLGE